VVVLRKVNYKSFDRMTKDYRVIYDSFGEGRTTVFEIDGDSENEVFVSRGAQTDLLDKIFRSDLPDVDFNIGCSEFLSKFRFPRRLIA